MGAAVRSIPVGIFYTLSESPRWCYAAHIWAKRRSRTIPVLAPPQGQTGLVGAADRAGVAACAVISGASFARGPADHDPHPADVHFPETLCDRRLVAASVALALAIAIRSFRPRC